MCSQFAIFLVFVFLSEKKILLPTNRLYSTVDSFLFPDFFQEVEVTQVEDPVWSETSVNSVKMMIYFFVSGKCSVNFRFSHRIN